MKYVVSHMDTYSTEVELEDGSRTLSIVSRNEETAHHFRVVSSDGPVGEREALGALAAMWEFLTN